MKARIFIALVLFSCYYVSKGENFQLKRLKYIYNIPDTIGINDQLIKVGFEEWTDGLPDNWSEIMDQKGKIQNNVIVTPESYLKSAGAFSIKVQSVEPFGGISHPLSNKLPSAWNIYPVSGGAAIHLAKDNGTSAYFSTHQLVQDDFDLFDNQLFSSAIRNVHALRIENGDYIELFSACSTSELSYQGAVYMKRNGGKEQLFLNYSDHRTWTWPGVVDMGSKYVFVSMRIGNDKVQRLFATDVSRDFNTITNDRLLFEIENVNLQCYSMIQLEDGRFIMPIVYADSKQVASGPWLLDVLFTDDFSDVTRLNNPISYPGRGLMEAYPVSLSDGTIAILNRTNQGHLAKAIFNPITNILSDAYPTEIIQPSAGSYARNLKDKSILLSWLADLNMRKTLVMAISEDDMQTWQSFHVMMSGAAMGHNMTDPIPYIHQPYVYEDIDGSIICYFEEVLSPSDINLYKTISGKDYRIRNVANGNNEWHVIDLDYPLDAKSVQLVNILESNGVAIFDQIPEIERLFTFQSGISIYPNPFTDLLQIKSDSELSLVEVMDINGQLIQSYEGMKIIPVAELIEGVYLIRVTSGAEIVTFKAIKTN